MKSDRQISVLMGIANDFPKTKNIKGMEKNSSNKKF